MYSFEIDKERVAYVKEHVRIDKYNMFAQEYSVNSKILYKDDIFGKLNISYYKNIKDWKTIRRTKNESIN
jgi:hypothetical protein